jgi:O-antigen ligase
MRTLNWLWAGCFFTASFDILLIFDFGGSIRISQIFLGVLCIAAAARVIQDGRILWPRGGTALVLWLLSQFLFLPLSGVLFFGVEFVALLTFTIAGFFAIIQIYGKAASLEWMMRLYLLSYIFVGLFGLFQFATPLLGFPGVLVQQWLLHGKFARISGFSFEPSYYATYMMIGWIMLVELRISKARMTSGRLWKWATIAVTAALVLSSSRTAWVVMLVELFARLLPAFWRGFRHTFRRFLHGRLVVRIPHFRLLLNAVILICVVVAGANYFVQRADPVRLLSGTGLANQPAHSYNDRSNAAADTFDMFKEHPFVGRSLGGVPINRALRHNVAVHSMFELRIYWGFPVMLEVLVASGVIGFIPFVVFFYVNTFGAMKLAKRYWPSEQAKWVKALARAMIFEWLVLLADQNLMRVYLWFHVTMVALVAYNLEFGKAAEVVAAVPALPSCPPLEALTTT